MRIDLDEANSQAASPILFDAVIDATLGTANDNSIKPSTSDTASGGERSAGRECPSLPRSNGLTYPVSTAKAEMIKDDTDHESTTLFFAECGSEQDVQDLCQEPEFQRQVRPTHWPH